MHHVDILNALAKKFDLKSYCEIGLFDSSLCFDHIKVDDKISIDPNPLTKPTFNLTSDQFFEGNTRKIDLYFIDGDHSFEQSYRDIINALDSLSDKGCIVVHDCNPTTEEMQQVPRIQNEWTGQVWKSVLKLRMLRSDVDVFTICEDYGCAVIRKGYNWVVKTDLPITYENFTKNRKSWLNLVNEEWFLKWLKR